MQKDERRRSSVHYGLLKKFLNNMSLMLRGTGYGCGYSNRFAQIKAGYVMGRIKSLNIFVDCRFRAIVVESYSGK